MTTRSTSNAASGGLIAKSLAFLCSAIAVGLLAASWFGAVPAKAGAKPAAMTAITTH